MEKKERIFKIGLPTIIALVLVAAILILFATPLKYGVETDSSDFDSLTIFSCEASGDTLTFTLPDGSFNERITVTLKDLTGETPLKDISQVHIQNDSHIFKIVGQNIRITDNSAYIILTGYRHALIAGGAESFGFAIHIKN